jgi:hypothetical protein
MAITLEQLKRSRAVAPPLIVIYGPEGVGKTTLAAHAPNPIFLPVEDGLGMMTDVPAFPLIKSYKELQEYLIWLMDEEHDFGTASIDSLDWLERLIWAEAAERNGWKDIRQPGFGEGYNAALDVWRELFDMLETLRKDRSMGVMMIAHAAIVNFRDPENSAYDVYQPKLHVSNKGVGANPFVTEAVDAVLFINKRTNVIKEQISNDKKAVGRTRAVGSAQRTVYTDAAAAYRAKNRWNMPAEITLPNDPKQSFQAVAQYIPFYNQAA